MCIVRRVRTEPKLSVAADTAACSPPRAQLRSRLSPGLLPLPAAAAAAAAAAQLRRCIWLACRAVACAEIAASSWAAAQEIARSCESASRAMAWIDCSA